MSNLVDKHKIGFNFDGENPEDFIRKLMNFLEDPKNIKESSKSTNIIIDLFLGSGSTLIACEKTNRICYGMELDTKYCDVIIERWEQFTGEKAKKV